MVRRGHQSLFRREPYGAERRGNDFRQSGAGPRRRWLASQLDRAPGCEEQAYLDGRHAGLDCSAIDQECLRSRDRELQRNRAAVQLRSGICAPLGTSGTQEHEEEDVKNVPDTPLGRMYRDHIQHILDKDIESLLNQYTDDALLISSFTKQPLYYKGRDRIHEHMQSLLSVQGLESDIAFWAETDDPQTLMIVEAITLRTADGESKMRFADSWVLRNGKI